MNSERCIQTESIIVVVQFNLLTELSKLINLANGLHSITSVTIRESMRNG